MAQRTALGLLFLVLAISFGGIAVSAAGAGQWPIAAAAAALGGWLVTLAGRGLRRR